MFVTCRRCGRRHRANRSLKIARRRWVPNSAGARQALLVRSLSLAFGRANTFRSAKAEQFIAVTAILSLECGILSARFLSPDAWTKLFTLRTHGCAPCFAANRYGDSLGVDCGQPTLKRLAIP